MPIDVSVYQYCEAQDIPIEYLEEYQRQPESNQWDWKDWFLLFFFIVLALPILIIVIGVYTVIKLAV